MNTVPEATLDAFRGHGIVRPVAIHEGWDAVEATLALLPEHGIDLERVTEKLLDDGLRVFEAELAKLNEALQAKLEEVQSP